MKKAQKRKRYVLMAPDSELGPEERSEAVRMLVQRYPDLDQRKIVWVGGSLIFRTDQFRLPEVKIGLTIRMGEKVMVPVSASGSISKLKRAAESPPVRKWSSSSRRNTSRRSSNDS